MEEVLAGQKAFDVQKNGCLKKLLRCLMSMALA
jgi:hypothetical protein